MLVVLWIAASLCPPSAEAQPQIDALYELDATAEPVGEHVERVLAAADKLVETHNEPATVAVWFEFWRMYERGKTKARAEALKLEAPKKVDAEAFAVAQKECPNSPEVIRQTGQFSPAKAVAVAKQVRADLAKKDSEALARVLPALWNLELVSAAGKNLEAFKAQVKKDAARLDPTSKRLSVLQARATAASLAGEPIAALSETLLTLYPYSEEGNRLAAELAKQMYELPPLPRLQRSQELVDKYPRYNFGDERFDVLADSDTLSAAELREVDERAEHILSSAKPSFHGEPRPLAVARVYVRHHLHVDAAPALLDRAQKQIDEPAPEQAPTTFKEQYARNQKYLSREVLALRLRLASDAKDLKRSRELLDLYDAMGGQDDRFADVAAVARSRVLRADGIYGDALAGLLAAPPSPEVRAELQSLWTDLGGSPENLAKLTDRKKADAAPAEEQWTKIDKALPEKLSLKDNHGKTWTAATLKGKRAFISIWASWCGPCKEELPHVVELAKLGQSHDVVVLTLNVDDDGMAARTYVAKTGLALPVIMDAKGLVDSMTSSNGIPRSWVIDKQGRLSHELIGYRPSPNWAQATLQKLESLTP